MTPRSWGSVAITSRFQAAGVDPVFVNSLAGLLNGGLRPGDAFLPAPIGQAAHHAGNNVIAAFLEHPSLAHCDSLLFLDYDHAFPPDTLERLRSSGQECDGLSALYISRTDNRPLVLRLAEGYNWDDPMFGVAPEWRRVGVVDVDLLSFGFTLLRRKMLAALPPPWFGYIHPEGTEDVAFSRAARLAGYRLAVETDIPIGHMTRVMKWPYEDAGHSET